VGGEKVLSRSV